MAVPAAGWVVLIHPEITPPSNFHQLRDTTAEPMKWLTIDIPAPLYARVKAGCALRGVKMADLLRAYLEREFSDS